VQHVIEGYLAQILKTRVNIVGCGRTDAQVHASQFFFHLDVEKPWDFDLKFRLNKNLPPDIAVFDILPIEDSRHARLDATQRTYDYFIHTYKDPFLNNMSALYQRRDLDLAKMKEATTLLLKYQDYRNFCKKPDLYRTTNSNITSARLFVDPKGDRYRFQISANRFLGGMIRILVHKLLEIGSGALTVDEFERYLSLKESPKTIKSAFAQGLFLSKVTYPFLDLEPRTEFFNLIALENAWQEL
jgi:tRNA pseudouridine38-40 synthase